MIAIDYTKCSKDSVRDEPYICNLYVMKLMTQSFDHKFVLQK